jgi:hypothetical protein
MQFKQRETNRKHRIKLEKAKEKVKQEKVAAKAK